MSTPDGSLPTLTRTQRQALAALRVARVGLWPAGRGRFAVHDADSRWSTRTLQALVDAGVAVWRGSSHETPVRHGIMPYVALVDTGPCEASGTRVHTPDANGVCRWCYHVTAVQCPSGPYATRRETNGRELHRCVHCGRVSRTQRPHQRRGRTTRSHDNTMEILWAHARDNQMGVTP